MIDTAKENLRLILIRFGGREGWDPVNWFNHTSWAAVITPTDRPKSVRNCCVIKVFGWRLVVIGLSQISSLFSWICFMIIRNGSIRRTATCVGALTETQRGESFALFPPFTVRGVTYTSYLRNVTCISY